MIKESFKLSKQELPIIIVNNNESLPFETINFQELAQDDNTDHSVLKEVKKMSKDVAILPYSSGTTGLPKGVELTHRNEVVNCVQQDVEGVKQYNDTTSKFKQYCSTIYVCDFINFIINSSKSICDIKILKTHYLS